MKTNGILLSRRGSLKLVTGKDEKCSVNQAAGIKEATKGQLKRSEGSGSKPLVLVWFYPSEAADSQERLVGFRGGIVTPVF